MKSYLSIVKHSKVQQDILFLNVNKLRKGGVSQTGYIYI